MSHIPRLIQLMVDIDSPIFRCAQKLDASSFMDAPDAEVYCKGCYAVR